MYQTDDAGSSQDSYTYLDAFFPMEGGTTEVFFDDVNRTNEGVLSGVTIVPEVIK